ncbi:MAG: zf-HC2 domain-containing protein [Bryobacteraceae bacterium]|jgi:anti-sigma factor RsiW
MSCSIENREEQLLDYVSGSLDTQDAALFEKHLKTCAACSEFVAGQKAVWEALDLFEPAPVSPAFDRHLYERISRTSWWDRLVASVSVPVRAPAFLRQGAPLVAAAAVLTAAVIVWERPAPAPPAQPAPLSAEADQTLQPDQVQRALDDMEMLREFNHPVVSDPAQSKM